MFKYFLIIISLLLTSCASTTPTSVVVETETIPVYLPSEVQTTPIYLHVIKDNNNNTLYSFDEANFILLKKFLIDITKNNNFTKEALCYYNPNICKTKIEPKE